MRETIVNILAIGLLLVVGACKNQARNTSDSQSLSSGLKVPAHSDSTLVDAQEFYEIAKSSYLKKMKTMGPAALSDEEQRFLEKFQQSPDSSGQVVQFIETMFEILESGRYGFKLRAIPAKEKVSRVAPVGLADTDVKKFFELIKMDYFKKVTKRPAPEMDARERSFFEQIQKRSAEKYDYHNDYLLISSDLFDTIEGL